VLLVIWKGLRVRWRRFGAVTLAVVLGVGLVAGSLVLTDGIRATFANLFTQQRRGVAVAVRSPVTGEVGREPVPAVLASTVAGVPGVGAVAGLVQGYAQLLGPNGRPLGAGGAPTVGVSIPTVASLNPFTLTSGRLPERDGELVVDARTATRHRLRLGDQQTVLFQRGSGRFTVVGTVAVGRTSNLAGIALLGFDLATAQRALGRTGSYDEVDVAAAPGVTASVLRSRVAAAVGPRWQVLTGGQLAAADTSDSGLGFLAPLLLTFSGIAVVVAVFLMVNALLIVAAQRGREFVLLRCLGATGRQLAVTVTAEALAVGLVASLLGLGAGVGVAAGLHRLFRLFGADLPASGLVLAPRTIVVALLVGVASTIAGALPAARRATRTSPMAALRDQTAFAGAGRGGAGRARMALGVVLVAAGAGLLAVGLRGHNSQVLPALAGVVPGGLLLLGGAVALGPLAARPLAGVIGAPLARALGAAGALGRDNARRDPHRTAATAAGLMIGVTVVTLVTIIAASLGGSIQQTVRRDLRADAILVPAGPRFLNPQVADRAAAVPGATTVAEERVGQWRLHGTAQVLLGVDPAAFMRVLHLPVSAGSLADLDRGGVAVSADQARANGWHLGDLVPMDLPRGQRRLPIRAIFGDRDAVYAPFLISLGDYAHSFDPGQGQDVAVLVAAAPGTDPARLRAALRQALADLPQVRVEDPHAYSNEQAGGLGKAAALFNVLLAFAVVIALLGIGNSLALAVLERTRELGLLRAIGMTTAQLGAMLTVESITVALLGALAGLGLGVLLGAALVRALASRGGITLAIPSGQLAVLALLAAAAGLVASAVPARRAAHLDPLLALSTD
jgi:putative ABC transport system permease protein